MKLKEVPYYVAFFDDSHNKICKKGQMNIHLRFWDDNEKIVTTRYYSYLLLLLDISPIKSSVKLLLLMYMRALVEVYHP